MRTRIIQTQKDLFRSFYIVLAVSGLILSSCGTIDRVFEAPAPKRGFAIDDLLITQESIPPLWQSLKTFFPYGDPLATNESIAMFYGKIINGEQKAYATQLIYRYDTNGVAQRVFDYQYIPRSHLHLPIEWHFKSSFVKESSFGCSEMAGNVGQSCEYAGRYEEFIIVFRTQMIANEMTLSELEKIVKAIDSRIAQYLGEYSPTP